jgi:hypothetical protein
MSKLRPLSALRSALCLTAFLILTACQMSGGFTSSRRAPVLGGGMQIGLPSGYCIDGQASHESEDTAVILMGRCTDAMKAIPALISVSIGQSASAGVMTAGGPALAAFFSSDQGRGTLARDGHAASVTIIEALGSDDAFLLHLQDTSAGEYWRAVIGIKSRLITISTTGTDTVPLPAEKGRAVMEATLKALRSANAP